MRKWLAVLIGALLIGFWVASEVRAATLSVTKIGTLDVTGQTFSQLSYTGLTQPAISGMASPSASVTLKINSLTATVSATASGAWTYQMSTLVVGTNAMTITSLGETITFNLVYALTSTPTPTPTVTATPTVALGGAADTSPLPEAGLPGWTLIVICGGGLLFLVGKLVKDLMKEWEGK